MDRIKECLKKCRLYNFNSRNGIKILLNIPDEFNLNNVRKNLLPYYNFFYLKKINKLLSQSLIEKNSKNINYPIAYLHSSLKKRSYTTNASTHKKISI